ncbi:MULTISPECIES: SusC/RagA family TonB-linked outer membrane protein [Bacteroides]|jgi:TonB-linked SusC/RagA family outer membrane protein|uniref:SusC/RagA family TonB-linked outer membrane protein n=1 Tax=Bacteroides TaxID=816 RepID=UPI000E4FA764|nr:MULTISPECIES: SusC/RagA family TonB-linked outer membrane protein [Bacteroides]RHL03219.1 SusC/RagA family TonB-linked outer membrane protein [Bacteroides sp. AF39-11AC]
MSKRILFLFFCVFALAAHSQNVVIKGSVTDVNKEPLLGVNIKVKGTSTGSITDIDGNFSINGPKGATLVISYIGMVTQEVEYKGQPLNVVLKDDSQALEEVVVVGYGTMRKKDLTGSVVQVRPDKLANENPKTVQDILRGTPGLAVGYNADAKGGGSLSIRGQRSLYTDGGHNDPLLILDGMMFYGELSEINPDDIGQIDVLKDASAAAVYGAKAANGVIIITTKKGKQGKPVINFSANIGLTQRSAYRERFSPSAYLQHYADWREKGTYGANSNGEWDAYQSGTYKDMTDYFKNPNKLVGVDLETWRSYTQNESGESDLSIWAKRLGFTGNVLDNIIAGKTVDWEDKAFRLGLNQDYNASISGASEKVDYYFSLGYLRNEGALIDDTYRAIRANMKLNAKVTKWFEVGANVNFQDRTDGSIDMDEDYFLRNSPYADYADENGNPTQYPQDETYSQRGYNYDFQKQYLELEKGYTVLNTILNAKVKLPFGITYQFNAAPRFQFFYDRYFMSAELPGSNPNDRGANREQAKRFDWSLNNTITWDKTFAEKHHFILTLAQEAEERRYWSDRIEARNILPSDALGFHNTQNGSKENSSYKTSDSHETADGMLARLFYSYDERYMLTTSIRRDGYSAFGSSNPYAYFPSVALAWTFSNEQFFQKFKNVMSTGKLRVSYGSNGNRSLSNPYVALANLYEGGGAYMGYITSSGDLQLMRYLMADRMANPTLQWEKTQAWNFALDFGFLNDRITGTLDVYKMSTKDMIMSQPLQNFTGFSNITTNLGQVDNNGFELSLNTVNIQQKNFQWNTTLNFSYNKNKIRHLFYEYEDVLDASGNVIGQKESDYTASSWFIGKPINEIWNYKVIGIWQKDEWEEAAKYKQVPGDPKVWNNPANDVYNEDGSLKTVVYNDDDKQFLGTTTPPINWSLRNEFTLWKDLTVSINIYSRMGHKGLSTNYLNNDDDGGRMSYAAACKEAKEYWTIYNPTNKYARIEAQGPDGAKSPGMLYDRSFIRLENISVGYTLPKQLTKKWDIERVKVFGTVRNVATWAKDWEYGDPETGGLGTRIYSFGVNLTF